MAEPEQRSPATPVPDAREAPLAEGQQPADGTKVEVLGPDAQSGAIAGGGSPLVNQLTLGAYGPVGDPAAMNAAAAGHFYLEAQDEKAEGRRLGARLSSTQEQLAEAREKLASAEAKLESAEKPWEERARNIVGGGLMGAAFKVWDWNAGMAIFLFILGLALIALPLARTRRKL